jgi:hypothetical protein
VAHDERSAEGRRGIQRPGEGAETAHQRTSGELAGSGHGFVADSACEQVGAAGQPRRREHVAHGADGKARRVKPGVRLLAHGVPARVAKLRALGNAIDPRPAAAFIGAVMECRP